MGPIVTIVNPDTEESNLHGASIPTRWQRCDPRFSKVNGDERMVRIASGYRWTEGPVYVPAGRYLLWNDIPNNRTLRWDETAEVVSTFRHDSAYANGNTLDRQGRVVTCEQVGRRVTRTEHDGRTTVVADTWNGLRFNSPNDVVVKSDDSIWFTDPSYGIDSDYEGFIAEPEIEGRHVFRVDPDSGTCEAVATDFEQPNGLAFSLDESVLYVIDSRLNHLRRIDLGDGSTLSGGEVLCGCSEGQFDGIRLDALGRIWAAAGDGVHVFDPDGTLLGKLLVPEIVTNLTFGGPKRNILFITAATCVYSVMLNVRGAPPWPERGTPG